MVAFEPGRDHATFPGHDMTVTVGGCRPTDPCPNCRERMAADPDRAVTTTEADLRRAAQDRDAEDPARPIEDRDETDPGERAENAYNLGWRLGKAAGLAEANAASIQHECPAPVEHTLDTIEVEPTPFEVRETALENAVRSFKFDVRDDQIFDRADAFVYWLSPDTQFDDVPPSAD